MYNIFSTKSRKRTHLQEGEPPPKKACFERDLLVKELAKNQRITNITLTEQLNKVKSFSTNQEYVKDIGECLRGKTNLKDFTLLAEQFNEDNKLRSFGLSERDLEIYRDYSTFSNCDFWLKYKDVNRDVLEKQLSRVLDTAKKVKPEFNNLNHTHEAESPLDMLPNLEKSFMRTIENCSKSHLKKIRKKARLLGQDIEALNTEKTALITVGNPIEKLNRNTLWDVLDQPTPSNKIISKKTYACKRQKQYTIKDGKIMALEDTVKKTKLSVEEIQNIPKFSNYSSGSQNKTLFIKNLSKRVNKEVLEKFLEGTNLQGTYVIKVLRCQAFIEFQEETQAHKGLDILNGVLVDGKPMIVQYSNKKP
ncbi:RNA-binding protein 41-like [Euwallacea fornicatus]|uniref:RNA-binding protein 41-like n=1 Tax=Euwallacea fornicatus TaxID=995702 RepID=UPI00338D4372